MSIHYEFDHVCLCVCVFVIGYLYLLRKAGKYCTLASDHQLMFQDNKNVNIGTSRSQFIQTDQQISNDDNDNGGMDGNDDDGADDDDER